MTVISLTLTPTSTLCSLMFFRGWYILREGICVILDTKEQISPGFEGDLDLKGLLVGFKGLI